MARLSILVGGLLWWTSIIICILLVRGQEKPMELKLVSAISPSKFTTRLMTKLRAAVCKNLPRGKIIKENSFLNTTIKVLSYGPEDSFRQCILTIKYLRLVEDVHHQCRLDYIILKNKLFQFLQKRYQQERSWKRAIYII